ncbi:hypothetical protein BJ508DRAFT_413763 [Ascobolus immersus RN42]|uniref:H-type lectin domain-containing protein n=1 Tax=Ascobolus immersus RN42 TaxID=1160509 RepID=A0A3N4ICC1_ASCIM|nr:hypothetical protein BJ508DRAFT_413763 [Ascobolus immersus RN42]
MSESIIHSGEITPTGVHTPSTCVGNEPDISDFTLCNHREPKTDEEILQRIAQLRVGLSESKLHLVSPMPDVFKQHPSCSTTLFSPDALLRSTFTRKPSIRYVTEKDTSVSIPGLVTAVRSFSKPQSDKDLCFFVNASNQTETAFDMQVLTWVPDSVKNIGVDWLEVPGEYLRSGMWQHGECYLDFQGSDHPRQLTHKVKFTKPFAAPPKVVVWLSGLHSVGTKPLRLNCGHKDGIKKDGFEMFAETWSDSKLYTVKLSWVAYDSGLKGVHSSVVDTKEFRTWKEPQHYNTRYAEFPAGRFTKAPKVMVGITRVDQPCSKDQNVWVGASNVTHLGMCWNANSWGNTVNMAIGLAYLAIEDWKS